MKYSGDKPFESSDRSKRMEDKELKKKLAKIPDVDKNGDPIYKIAGAAENSGGKSREKSGEKKRSESK